MSAEFRSLVELALSAPITNPQLIMSFVDENRELGDMHDWSTDVDSLVKAFESQGGCLLGLRSGRTSFGAFMCMDQGGDPADLVMDHTDNKVMKDIYNAWILTGWEGYASQFN